MKNEKNNFGFIAASSICIFLLLIVLVGNVGGKGTRAASSITGCLNEVVTGMGDTVCLQCDVDNGYNLTPDGSCKKVTCSAGQYLDGLACKTCPVNSYCTGDGTIKSCTTDKPNSPAGSDSESDCVASTTKTCSENQYFNSNDKKCYSCPTNSTSPAGSTGILSCKCSAGTFLNSGNVCETCPSGFTSQPGSQSKDDCNIPTTTCDANKYFDSATKKCESCPTNSSSPAGSNGVASCKCNANYYKNGTSCTACPANSTSDAGSNSVASCKCSADYYMDDSGSCSKCPAGYTSQKGSQGKESCVPKDNDCKANYYYDLGTKKCIECPANSTSEAKSVGFESCKCNSGFRLNTVSNSCIVDCAAGKYVDGTSCKTCPANYYCPGNRSELDGRKYACPENSTSQSGSQSIDDCICKSGYVMNKSTQKCELKSSSSNPDSSSKPSSSSTPGGNNGGNNNGGDDTGSDNGGNNNATNNPQTGSALIFVVWSIGIAMVVYAFWYFKTSKEY